jgi:hypothetical protein
MSARESAGLKAELREAAMAQSSLKLELSQNFKAKVGALTEFQEAVNSQKAQASTGDVVALKAELQEAANAQEALQVEHKNLKSKISDQVAWYEAERVKRLQQMSDVQAESADLKLELQTAANSQAHAALKQQLEALGAEYEILRRSAISPEEYNTQKEELSAACYESLRQGQKLSVKAGENEALKQEVDELVMQNSEMQRQMAEEEMLRTKQQSEISLLREATISDSFSSVSVALHEALQEELKAAIGQKIESEGILKMELEKQAELVFVLQQQVDSYEQTRKVPADRSRGPSVTAPSLSVKAPTTQLSGFFERLAPVQSSERIVMETLPDVAVRKVSMTGKVPNSPDGINGLPSAIPRATLRVTKSPTPSKDRYFAGGSPKIQSLRPVPTAVAQTVEQVPTLVASSRRQAPSRMASSTDTFAKAPLSITRRLSPVTRTNQLSTSWPGPLAPDSYRFTSQVVPETRAPTSSRPQPQQTLASPSSMMKAVNNGIRPVSPRAQPSPGGSLSLPQGHLKFPASNGAVL